MSNSSPDAGQLLILFIGGLVGIWQFRKGLSAWKNPEVPKSLVFFPLTRLRQQNRTTANLEHQENAQSSTDQRIDAFMNMLVGLFLMLLPLAGMLYVLFR